MSDIRPASVQGGLRSANDPLERRTSITTAVILLGLGGVAWWSTVENARDMSSMVQGLAQVGTAMPFDMSALVFIGMWTTMMVAMMVPCVAPIVLLHRTVAHRRREGVVPTVAFGAGYLTVWALSGLLPLAALVALRHVAPGTTWVERVGGAVFVLAGIYQFTHWKEMCLRACRVPSTVLATPNFGPGTIGALRAGLTHGLWCLGCCGALMAVLFVVGVMNLAWMAALSVVFLAEKNWRHGARLAGLVGVATVAFGIAILLRPPLLGPVALNQGT